MRVLALFFSVFASAACSSVLGDFTVGDRPPDDAGAAPADAGRADAASPDAAAAVVQVAIAPGVSVYVGQVATLDASRSTTTRGSLSFAWSVKSAPPGSAVTTATLQGRNTPTVQFLPDVEGEYALSVTVQAGCASDTKAATLDVAAPEVLYAQGTFFGGQGAAAYTISKLDGGGAHPVLCPDVVSGASSEGATLGAFAGRAYDFWEGPAGQPSRFAAFTLDSEDGGGSAHLWTGTSGSSCNSSVVDLGSSKFGPGRPFGSEPSFKPDGSRFAVFDQKWRILTYASDGSGAPNVVGTYPVPPSFASQVLDPVGVGANGYVQEPPRVVWTQTGLAWAAPTQSGWQIIEASDTPGSSLTTYMNCPGVVPREIALLDDGTVIASYRTSPSSSENLYQLKPDATRNCVREQQYTRFASPQAIATDFAVSPDETEIAYAGLDPSTQDASFWMQGDSQLPGGYVSVVPVGGGAPILASGPAALYGPRWIGGGTLLVFTRLDGISAVSGHPATSVVVMAPNGANVQVVARGDGMSTFVSTSGNAACSATAGPLGGGAALLWLVPLAAGVARRRRRPADGPSLSATA